MAAAEPAADARGIATGVAVSLAGALAARAAHLPLPWLLGPLLAIAALHLSGRTAPTPAPLRSAGQLVVGAAVGLAFSPAVAALALAIWPLVLVNAVAMTLLGIAGAWLLHRWTRVDLRTCYLSAAIGGASDMQALAERFGAQADVVAAAHVLRIGMVVLVVPLALTMCLGEGAAPAADAAAPFSLARLGVLLAIAAAAGWTALRCDVPNAWGIAPLLASCACAVSGLDLGTMPAGIVHAGQLAIGWSLGSRFSAGFFRARPRFLVAVGTYTLALLLATVLLGSVLGGLATQSVPSLVLGAAPGGVAEMSLTARTLALDVPLVTSLQLTRVVAAALLTAPLLMLLQRKLLVTQPGPRDTPR